MPSRLNFFISVCGLLKTIFCIYMIKYLLCLLVVNCVNPLFHNKNCIIATLFKITSVDFFYFSAYGEGIFLAIQTFVIACLVLAYSSKTLHAVGLAAVYTGIMAYLLSPTASMSLLSTLQAMVIPQLILSRVSKML